MQNNIRGIVFSKYPNITMFAKDMNWDRRKASRIVNGIQRPSADDMEQMADCLEINDDSTFVSIFFNRQSTK